MKPLIAIFSLFYFISAIAAAPYGIKGQQQATTLYSNVHQFPNNQVTNTGGINALVETGNKNILDNAGFEHSTFSTSWTNSAGTFTQETSTVIDGKASAKLVFSSQTMSLTQSSTLYASAFADGIQGLVSARIKSDVAIKLCAIKAGTVSTTDCVDIAADNKWSHYQVPIVLGATSNGISIASSGAVTGTVFVDDAYLGAADPFVSAPLITEWVDYGAMTIGASTSAPTKATVKESDNVKCRQVGQDYECEYVYRADSATGSLAGSGGYLFSLPSGIEFSDGQVLGTISTNSASFNPISTTRAQSKIGFATITNSAQFSYNSGVAYAVSGNRFQVCFLQGLSDGGCLASAYFPLTNTSLAYNFTIKFRGKNITSSINTITQQCQNDTECTNEFSAVISDTGSITSKNLDWISSCVKSGTSNYITTCTFNSGIFTTAPSCAPTAVRTASSGGWSTNLVSTSSTQVVYFTGGGSSSVANDPVHLICQKQSTDYKARRAIVGSFKNVVTTQGVNRPATSSVIVAGGTESTICTVTGNCTLYRLRGNFITSVAKTATGGSYTVTLDSTKVDVSTVSCSATVIRDTSGNQVCHPSTMGSTFTVFCRDVTANAVANNIFRISCEGDSL